MPGGFPSGGKFPRRRSFGIDLHGCFPDRHFAAEPEDRLCISRVLIDFRLGEFRQEPRRSPQIDQYRTGIGQQSPGIVDDMHSDGGQIAGCESIAAETENGGKRVKTRFQFLIFLSWIHGQSPTLTSTPDMPALNRWAELSIRTLISKVSLRWSAREAIS